MHAKHARFRLHGSISGKAQNGKRWRGSRVNRNNGRIEQHGISQSNPRKKQTPGKYWLYLCGPTFWKELQVWDDEEGLKVIENALKKVGKNPEPDTDDTSNISTCKVRSEKSGAHRTFSPRKSLLKTWHLCTLKGGLALVPRNIAWFFPGSPRKSVREPITYLFSWFWQGILKNSRLIFSLSRLEDDWLKGAKRGRQNWFNDLFVYFGTWLETPETGVSPEFPSLIKYANDLYGSFSNKNWRRDPPLKSYLPFLQSANAINARSIYWTNVSLSFFKLRDEQGRRRIKNLCITASRQTFFRLGNKLGFFWKWLAISISTPLSVFVSLW